METNMVEDVSRREVALARTERTESVSWVIAISFAVGVGYEHGLWTGCAAGLVTGVLIDIWSVLRRIEIKSTGIGK